MYTAYTATETKTIICLISMRRFITQLSENASASFEAYMDAVDAALIEKFPGVHTDVQDSHNDDDRIVVDGFEDENYEETLLSIQDTLESVFLDGEFWVAA